MGLFEQNKNLIFKSVAKPHKIIFWPHNNQQQWLDRMDIIL